jgi:hypothetical protein
MPVWFFVVLGVIVLFAVVLALTMGFGRRSAGGSGGQNTTIVERRPSSDRRNTTVVEGD